MVANKEQFLERIDTGIPGFDEMLGGGFYKGTINVVTGETGTGKTIFGSQYLGSGLQKGEKCMCIVTSEMSDFVKKEMYTSFGWDFWKLEESGDLVFVDVTDPELRLQKAVELAPMELIKSFRKLIDRRIGEEKPRRVFIDSIEALFLAIESKYRLRTIVDDMFDVLRGHGVTVVVSSGTMFGIAEAVEYGADSVTRLGRMIAGNNLQRTIYVAKLRGSSTSNEIRVLNISNKGLSVLKQSPYLGSTG